MSEGTTTRAINPAVLERLRTLNVVSAKFAFFEHCDEWSLEDIRVESKDGSVIEEANGDLLESELGNALEEATYDANGFGDGYFELNALEGTIRRLDQAFVTELRWWQLEPETQEALIVAKLV